MSIDEYEGWNKKFTVYDASPIDCYLQIGVTSPHHWIDYPHLAVGEICHLDIKLSKQGDEIRVYEVLMLMCREVIRCGGTVRDVIAILKNQKLPPCGITNDEEIPMCHSICDYIGRYLDLYQSERN